MASKASLSVSLEMEMAVVAKVENGEDKKVMLNKYGMSRLNKIEKCSVEVL
jgi:hypothetical protein